MSAWTKFATNFFHEKQKQNPDFKFSQALKQASPLFKKMKKGGSSKMKTDKDGKLVQCEVGDVDPACLPDASVVEEGEKEEQAAPGEVAQVPVPVPVPVQGEEVKEGEGEKEITEVKEEGKEEEDILGGKKGGRKSQKKAKKAGKKSQKKQKKAKKAGSKKSKK